MGYPQTPVLCSSFVLCRYKISWDQFTHRLVLPSVRLSDGGEYTAVAGSNMSKANLGVEGRDVRISEPANRNVSVSSLGAVVNSSGATVRFMQDLVYSCRLLRSTEQLWRWR